MAENTNNNISETYQELFKAMKYSKLSKTIIQDLVNQKKESVIFKQYTKEQVINFLLNPQTNEKQIRDMSIFLYSNSSHYRRLCNYFSKLPTYNYTIIPYNLNPNKYNKDQFLFYHRKVSDLINKFNFKYQLSKIFNICMYQDVFAGLYFETADSFDISQINNDYIKISSKEDSCLVFSIDMNYFKTREYLLDSYGDTLKQMYYDYVGYTKITSDGKKITVKGDSDLRWQEPPNQICFKVNDDQLLYPLPPFAGIFPEILNLEEYKLLKKAGEILDRYKILAMKIPINKDDGRLLFDDPTVTKFYNQACGNIDTGVGLIVSPMEIEKFDFQKNAASDSDAVNQAESALFSASGSNGALFGLGDKLSSSSLNMSIKNDESLIFAMLRQAENWINKYIKSLNLPYDFKIQFLDQSIYNVDEVCDRYQKSAVYGVAGSKSLYAASLGVSPSDIIGLTELEQCLDFNSKWTPLQSSNTLASNGSDNTGGRPTQDKVDDTGEATRENDSNANR